VNGFEQFIAMYNSGCHICCKWFRHKSGFKCASTPKYHATDKHDPPSQFKPTLWQSAQL